MLLDTILDNLKSNPDDNCCKHDKQYTNREFYELICKVYYLIKDAPKDRPIVVYGHKDVYMVASFLACSFLGIAYVPIDKKINDERIEYILSLTKPSYIIGDYHNNDYKSISFSEIKENSKYDDINTVELKPDDTYYILFTSGSTGKPKGVKVSYDNLNSCIEWLKDITKLKNRMNNYTIYNQAIFSFDLSVSDIYLSLYVGANHYIGIDFDMMNMSEHLKDLSKSKANLMVLTPSYAELLCLDSKFSEKLMPNLKTIMFCGEKLTKKLVAKLYDRFSNIKIINMYGPTECTFAVTYYEVPRDCDENISIGVTKKDTKIYIVDDNLNMLPDEVVGEIMIVGKSVAKGYIKCDSDKVVLNKGFITFNGEKAYLTGDLGYIKNDLIYYVARKDSQIKYKGYRIELLDIENNIAKIEGVSNVAVDVEKDEDGNAKRIIALIVASDEYDKNEIKEKIRKSLPEYMIPQIKFVECINVNINGKKKVF